MDSISHTDPIKGVMVLDPTEGEAADTINTSVIMAAIDLNRDESNSEKWVYCKR